MFQWQSAYHIDHMLPTACMALRDPTPGVAQTCDGVSERVHRVGDIVGRRVPTAGHAYMRVGGRCSHIA